MKKAGLNAKKNDDILVFAIIVIIVVAFVFSLKYIYQFVENFKFESLFKKLEQPNTSEVDPNVPVTPEDTYTILQPVGTNTTICKKIISDEGGDETINVSLYSNNNNLKSIQVNYSYSGITDEYVNYILSEQSKFKQKKTTNLSNKGYSIEIDLVSTSSLKVFEVILLEKTKLEELNLGVMSNELSGEYDQDISELMDTYLMNGYTCE